MPRVTLFAREPEDIQEMGANEFAFIALRDLYDLANNGELENQLKAAGFRYGNSAVLSVVGRILNPLTGYDETFTDLQSDPVTIRSAAAVVGVVRALLRQRMSLPMSGSESGVKNSEHVYYTSEITLSWQTASPAPQPTPLPPPPIPAPSPLEVVKQAVGKVVSTVKSFFKRLFGR